MANDPSNIYQKIIQHKRVKRHENVHFPTVSHQSSTNK